MCHLEIIEEELSKLKNSLRDLAEERQSLRLKEKEKITKETEINLLDETHRENCHVWLHPHQNEEVEINVQTAEIFLQVENGL